MAGPDDPRSDDAAVEALDTLGLSTYQSKVFIGLQKLGSGTAREIAEVTDVPRSQVYGAADALAEYGLVDVQQGTPTRFRPVAIEEAREQLVDRVESTADEAFEYIESVSGDYEQPGARSEAIWTVTGTEHVSSRAATLTDDAEARVVYGTSERDHLEGVMSEALRAAADRGVDVLVVSVEAAVGEAVEELFDDIAFHPISEDSHPEESTARMLICDDDTVLMSVSPTEKMPTVTEETAFWTAGGAFATVLVALMEERLGELSSAARGQS